MKKPLLGIPMFLVCSLILGQGTGLLNEEEWYLQSHDSTEIYVHEFGHGPTVVGLHGGYGQEHSYMIDFLYPLQGQFRFILFDQRGALRSPVPDSLYHKKITIENYVMDLEQLRIELGESKLKLIAHSMGAHYAYEYLAKHPKHVEEIIIISGFIPKWPNAQDMAVMREAQSARARFVERADIEIKMAEIEQNTGYGKSKMESYKWKLLYASGQIFNLENWQKVRGGRSFYNPRLNQYLSPEKTGVRFNFLNNIKSHPYPIHYIFGYHEFGDYGVRLHQKWLGEFKNVNLHILDKAAHSVWLDRPGAFQKILLDALN